MAGTYTVYFTMDDGLGMRGFQGGLSYSDAAYTAQAEANRRGERCCIVGKGRSGRKVRRCFNPKRRG